MSDVVARELQLYELIKSLKDMRTAFESNLVGPLYANIISVIVELEEQLAYQLLTDYINKRKEIDHVKE